MKSPLKEQVPLLFRKLQQLTRFASSSNELMERSLIGHFVPFRSPSLKELPNREESIRFGRSLWSRILGKSRPRMIVCVDKDTYPDSSERANHSIKELRFGAKPFTGHAQHSQTRHANKSVHKTRLTPKIC